MKYFGKKSLSSLASGILHVSWYVVLIVSIVGVVIGSLALFYKPFSDCITSEIEKGVSSMNYKDKTDWENFKNLPIVFKLIIIPYFGSLVVLLLQIIKKSQILFTNFKNDIVFDKSNAAIISNISKLNIGFSILTFNFSLLLVSVLLFMLCEIFKKGSVLQEEHDFTV
ncbi:MAG: hypothetical protein A2086_15750 [Spirochaetes bacterium GWD1_27_9]|nr:MAG: hypothetical protein A2Z98_11020 [Spirochaetes bacterium GWB1_27_13]OHD27099.1 MAG: hypothetical protein A2Y34_11420 [Spirochaetes bacterium GWC1_27_15]OHD42835.1 MAG: hypothetical protein A2086_15750 [Spirochaetes bacterium GWD1_27_9]